MVSWMKHLTLSGVTNLASKQHTKDNLKYQLSTLFDLWEGGGKGSVCKMMQSKHWAWGMFAKPITRHHHTWNKEGAEADELLLLSLRWLPFGEGGICKRGDGLKQSPWVSSSQRCSVKGMRCVGSLELWEELREKGRRQPGPSGSALSTAGRMEVLGLSQQGQKHKTNQAGPSTDSGTGDAPGEHFSEKKQPLLLLLWPCWAEISAQRRNAPASAPLPPPHSGSSWNILPAFHPVKYPPSPLLIAQTWLLMSPLVFTDTAHLEQGCLVDNFPA